MGARAEQRRRNRVLYGSIKERERALLAHMSIHGPLSGARLMELTGWPSPIAGGALAHLQMTGQAFKDGEVWVRADPVLHVTRNT